MIDPLIEKQLLTQLSYLRMDQQQRVLDFARFLAMKTPVGIPGQNLLGFAGTIASNDLKLMSEAIEVGCEQVDLNGW